MVIPYAVAACKLYHFRVQSDEDQAQLMCHCMCYHSTKISSRSLVFFLLAFRFTISFESFDRLSIDAL
jgi:hypothetical protein